MTCKWPKAIPEELIKTGRVNAEESPDKNPTIQAQLKGKRYTDDGNAELYMRPVSICQQVVHVGIFFDGTNNNSDYDLNAKTHTNVVRLHEAFDEDKVRRHKIYLQGVGTPFKELHEFAFSTNGKAFADGFNNRIAWAYLQLLNRIYLAFDKPGPMPELLNLQDAYKLATELGNTPYSLAQEAEAENAQQDESNDSEPEGFEPLQLHVPRELQAKQKILAGYQRDLDKPKRIKRLYLHVFGFSRGAAAARVFVNMLSNYWAKNGKLCGRIPYSINFVGLFDTVSSVGLAYSANYGSALANLTQFFDGHGKWARPEHLRIPTTVRRCVHYVAMHEQRASFPSGPAANASHYTQELPCAA